MTELKTLKDIYEDIRGTELTFNEFYYLLKKEAIKWVKELSNYNTDIFSKYQNEGNTNSAVQFINHFFNITEEELKGGLT